MAHGLPGTAKFQTAIPPRAGWGLLCQPPRLQPRPCRLTEVVKFYTFASVFVGSQPPRRGWGDEGSPPAALIAPLSHHSGWAAWGRACPAPAPGSPVGCRPACPSVSAPLCRAALCHATRGGLSDVIASSLWCRSSCAPLPAAAPAPAAPCKPKSRPQQITYFHGLNRQGRLQNLYGYYYKHRHR